MRQRHLAAGLECHTAQAAGAAVPVPGDHHAEPVPGQMEGKACHEEREW